MKSATAAPEDEPVSAPARGGEVEVDGAAPVRRRYLVLATVGSALVAAGWAVTAVLTAGHGFDLSDEGFYLLSYRWWRTNTQTFTGAQYLYGPVFQLLGHDIAGLRLVRLATVLGTHLAFGWAFVGWLRGRRPGAPSSRWWEAAGAAVIVACGGTAYGWLGLSPGYNDVALLGALLAVAVVLRIATHVDRQTPVPAWVPALLGPVAVAMLLAKWASSALVLGVVAVAAAVALAPRGWRAAARAAAWAVAGAVVTAIAVHLLVVPLTTALPDMLATNQLVADRTNSPLTLLKLYLRTTKLLALGMADGHLPLFAAAVLAVVARGRVGRFVAAVVAVAAVAWSAWRLISEGYAVGGASNLGRYPVALMVVLAVPVLVGLAAVLDRRAAAPGPTPASAPRSALRSEGWRGWALLAAVAAMPVAQAAGTGNPLHFMVVNGFAAWAALMVAVFTGIGGTTPVARSLTGVAIAAAVLLSFTVAFGGLWSHPYRADPRDVTTATVPGVPALDGVRLSPEQAADLAGLRQRLAPYLDPPGRAVMAFDELAGLVLVLDGRPVGEAWYSKMAQERTAAGIRTVCADGRGWWGTRLPIVILDRAVTETVTGALQSCGLVLETGYRLLAPPGETLGLQVYVPTT